uniref:Selenocysteine lyase n=1 Tax=Hippocampus comes TaxID=109280 RepID=A0A3Q2YEA6_HIPCM
HHFVIILFLKDYTPIYMDYNATTPVAPEVIRATYDAMRDAWGNPRPPILNVFDVSLLQHNFVAFSHCNLLLENVARMIGGNSEDIIFTSGGTESNNMVLHTAVEHFWKSQRDARKGDDGSQPHIIASDVEHDSVKLVAEHLKREGKVDFTCVPVSKTTGRVEADDVVAAVRPNTCLVSIMLANNETGIIMPIREISQRVRSLRQQDGCARVLIHTDAAQALGKIPVDVKELGVDYLTIVGHKGGSFYGPRIGALYVNGLGVKTPLYSMLFGGGQERNFRPGYHTVIAAELVTDRLSDYESHMLDVREYLEERLKAVFKDKLHFNNHFQGSDRLPNTCNVSILGPGLQGWRVLSHCKKLLASVGAACHSDHGDRPSPILLSCGVTPEVASNALRLSVGHRTSREDVDVAVKDLQEAVKLLEQSQ